MFWKIAVPTAVALGVISGLGIAFAVMSAVVNALAGVVT